MTATSSPRSLAEALSARRAAPDALVVAGGTDVMVAVNAGRVRPSALLDVSHVEELNEWRQDDGRVFVGAGVTFARIAAELGRFPPLQQGARALGSPQIRNRATLGGNIGTASPAGDGLAALAAYDADILLACERGTRRVRWDAFVLGPKRTALRPDELIVGAEWRTAVGPGAFAKVGTRNAMVIAIASVALAVDAVSRTVRLALGSVAPTVVRAADAEGFAAGAIDWSDPERPLDRRVVAEFARLAVRAARPIDDLRGSAAYRRLAIEVLARRTLSWVPGGWREAC